MWCRWSVRRELVKILLLHDYGTATGGAELQMLALRRGLRARGHDVRLFTSRAKHVGGEVQADHSCFGATGHLQVLTQTYNPSAVRQLKAVLRSFRPDIVHARMILYQLSPAILPLLTSYPAVYQAAMYRAICPLGTRVLPDGSDCTHIAGRVCLKERCVTPQSWVMLMLQRMLWQRGRGVFSRYVALSHVMRDNLEAGGLSPVMVIHNGVPERAMRAPLPATPRVVYAGRLAREKGVDLLLRAFAATHRSVPSAKLDIIGDGPLRASLMQLVESLQLTSSVRFLGHLTRERMEAECDAAWVQAVPSQWHEPFGNVSTEAMMRGTAVVASDVGGQRDIVRHEETGLLVPAHHEGAWTRAMTTLLTDQSLAERYGAAGRARALTSFSERACLDQWEALYAEVIAERSLSAGVRGDRMTVQPADDTIVLSVVVVTAQTFRNVRRTVRHLRQQTIASQMELIIVAPDRAAVADAAPHELSGFGRVEYVEVGPLIDVDREAARAVPVATAPLIAFIEDHAFAEPQWAEAMVTAHRGPWVAVASTMVNANPERALSWCNLLVSYASSVEPVVEGEREAIPGHNLSYKREALLPFGDTLRDRIVREGGLLSELRSRGGRFLIAERARVHHINPSTIPATVEIRWHAGRLYGARRASSGQWGFARRALYVALGPLIPVVRFSRVTRELFGDHTRDEIARRVKPAIFAGLIVDALGQMAGYALGAGQSLAVLTRYELDRMQHITRAERQRFEELRG